MVSFQCHACGDVVKKPKLDHHRNYCHSGFDCIDCHTTFNSPAEYKGHTQCITEAEKYQKSLWKGAKPNRKNPRDPNVGMYQNSRGARAMGSGANSAPLGAPARMTPVVTPPDGNKDSATDDGKKAGNQKLNYTAGMDNVKLNGIEPIDKNSKDDRNPAEPTSIPLPSSPEKVLEEGPDKTKEKKAKKAKKDKKKAEKSSEPDEKADVGQSASTEDATANIKKKEKSEKKKRKSAIAAEVEVQPRDSTAVEGGAKEKKSKKEKSDKQENVNEADIPDSIAVDTKTKSKKSKKDRSGEGASEGDGETEKPKKRKREDDLEVGEDLDVHMKDVKDKKKKKHGDSQKEGTTTIDIDLSATKTDASDGKGKKLKKDKKAKKSKEVES